MDDDQTHPSPTSGPTDSLPNPDVLSQTEDGTTIVLNLESMIKSHVTGIDKRKVELKQYSEMLKNLLTNDSDFQELEEKVKNAGKERNARRAQLLRQGAAVEMTEKVNTLKGEIKEMDEAISDYASEYQRMSGSNEIEIDKNDIREIIYVAKLIKKGKKRT